MLAQEANDHEEREHYARLRDAWTKLAKGCEPFNFSDVTENRLGDLASELGNIPSPSLRFSEGNPLPSGGRRHVQTDWHAPISSGTTERPEIKS